MSHNAKGGKVRRGGLAEAAVRRTMRARVTERIQDPEAQAVAQGVYAIAIDLKASTTPTVMPLDVEAPLTMAVERMATGIAARDGLPVDERTISDIAGYLLAMNRWEVQEFTPEKLEAWRARQASAS